MPCFGPLVGYYSKDVNPDTGKRPLTFDVRRSNTGVRINLPCGECVGCLMERGRQWSVRITHEKRMHQDSSFLTLTYSDSNIPRGGTLVLSDLQRFMKRLRKQRPAGIRFFACGEYGETTFRPHYHVLLLNVAFTDMKFYKASKTGFDLFRSAELTRLWPVGDHYIGVVTPESAGYVAGYCLKKFSAPAPDGFYATRQAEFRVMSRNPGLGSAWFDKYFGEAYAHDSAIINSREVGLPRYYDTKFEALDPDRLRAIKRERKAEQVLLKPDNTRARLNVKERVALLNVNRFKRDLT